MGNPLLDRLEARYEAQLEASERIMCQWMVDTLQITLHEKYGWGYDRLKALEKDWFATRKKYKAAMKPTKGDKHDSAYWQEKLDAAMADICKSKQAVIPFEERYPELRRPTFK